MADAAQGYPRRILLCVTGLTPQVVTETVYALAQRTPAFVPTEVHIVTTAEGESRARLELVDPRRSQLARLCKQYRIALPLCDETTIHVIRRDGLALSDMRSAPENEAAADCILDLVRLLTADDSAQIHFSIAGGRKTMGFYLGYCASVLARAQDDISHVLVSPPFESLPGFFFPPRPPEVIHDREGKPHDTRDAQLSLAPVAFIRLRRELPPALLQGRRSFGDTVRLLNALQGAPSLTLRLLPAGRARSSARYGVEVAGGLELQLPPKSFALLWMFAQLASSGTAAARFVHEADWRVYYRRLVLPVYGAVSGHGLRWEHESNALEKTRDNSNFRNEVDKLNKIVRDGLGANAGKIYGIQTAGRGRLVRYWLGLPAPAIQLQNPDGITLAP